MEFFSGCLGINDIAQIHCTYYYRVNYIFPTYAVRGVWLPAYGLKDGVLTYLRFTLLVSIKLCH